jgi:hypothetical protein
MKKEKRNEGGLQKRFLAVHRRPLKTRGLYPASEGERPPHSAIENLFGVEKFEKEEKEKSTRHGKARPPPEEEG